MKIDKLYTINNMDVVATNLSKGQTIDWYEKKFEFEVYEIIDTDLLDTISVNANIENTKEYRLIEISFEDYLKYPNNINELPIVIAKVSQEN